jgi:hypothetical protein
MFDRHNRDRLYIGFYPTGGGAQNNLAFHVALLLVPKARRFRKSTHQVSRYHVTNPISPDGKQVWQYEAVKAEPCSNFLCGLLLLGKLSPQFSTADVDAVLAEVPVVQDDPNWRCRHWLLDAIQVILLQSAGTDL